MSATKLQVLVEESLVREIDRLVADHVFPDRDAMIGSALVEKLSALRRERLERECAKLDPAEEQEMAEEGMGTEAGDWPTY